MAATALLTAAGTAQTMPPSGSSGEPEALDLQRPRERTAFAPAGCASVVLRACVVDPVTPPRSASASNGAVPSAELTQTADQVLARVVIERERIRPLPTVREVIEAATARRSWREFESGEGGRCACASPCPPWPQACCTCTKGGRDAMIDNVVRH